MKGDKPIAVETPAAAELDPFAGDDEPWAEEDLARAWIADVQTGRGSAASKANRCWWARRVLPLVLRVVCLPSCCCHLLPPTIEPVRN